MIPRHRESGESSLHEHHDLASKAAARSRRVISSFQLRWARGSAAVLLAVSVAGGLGRAVAAAPEEQGSDVQSAGDHCLSLAAAPWPSGSLAQTAHLRRLEAAAARCNAEPRFLAALGGAWLELGDARQALPWLERALMLDPALEAALADHALALAALGEPVALQELLGQWAGRSDVPPALWRRLQATAQQSRTESNGVAAMARKLIAPESGWQQRGEVQILGGHESNLAQSPILDELVITPPDGPISLPLAEPLKAESGSAASWDASWQAATSNAQQQSFLIGVQALGRHSPRKSDTDWHSLRVAFSAGQRLGQWRWRLQTRLHSNGGPLSEPSRQTKWALSAEGPLGPCSQRWSIETDRLRYRNYALNDVNTTAVVSAALCPMPWVSSWAFGVSVRGADERATDELRPGGDQRHTALALRLLGDLGAAGTERAWTLDAQWHLGRAKDERGYSVLLENNATRVTKTQLFSVELAGPASFLHQSGARAVFQLHLHRQSSNLPLFAFDSASIYAGMRFGW